MSSHVMVIVIVSICAYTVLEIIRMAQKNKGGSEVQNRMAVLEADVETLKGRISVLERIQTDPKERLRKDIDALVD